MSKGGFKVLVNGRVQRCYQLEVDYDKATISFNNGETVEDFERDNFAVSTEKEEKRTARRL